AERILDAVEKHLDLVPDLELAVAAGSGKFAQGHAALGLQADVDDGHVFLDRNHLALDDGAFLQVSAGKGLIQHRGKIIARGVVTIRCRSTRSHMFSRCESKPAALGERAYRTCSVGSRITPEPLTLRNAQRAGRQMPARSIR